MIMFRTLFVFSKNANAEDKESIMPMKVRMRYLVYLLLFLSALAACKKGEIQSTSVVQSEPIHKVYEQQPIRLDYTVSNSAIRVADRLEVVLSFHAPEDYEVVFPKFDATVGKFELADQYEDLLELVDKGSLLHKKTIVLEPALAGGYAIPALKIEYWEKEKPEKTNSLTTDEVQITVNSLLEKEQQQNIDISDIAPPVPLPSKRIYWILGAAVLAVLLIGCLLWWRRGKRNGQGKDLPQDPAHIIAFHALDVLLASDLLKKGRIKEFYLNISDILRRYIENRFTLHAPERTTEEFLIELGAAAILQLQHKTLLKEFLGHCDQVKFAQYQPVDEEIEKTMSLCRQFINDTKRTDIDGGKRA